MKAIPFTKSNDSVVNPLTQFVPGLAYISDMPLESWTIGWASPGYDLGNGNGMPIALRGPTPTSSFTYSKGIGWHAPGGFTVTLGGRYARFIGQIGNNMAANWAGSIRYTITTSDGRTLWDDTATGTVRTPTMPAAFLDLDVRGVNRMTVYIDDGGNGNNNDAGDIIGYFLPNVTSTTLSPRFVALAPGATATLTANVSTAPLITPPPALWTTSDASIATVDATGVVTAVAPGTAVISLFGGSNTTDSCVVRVAAPAVTALTVSPTSIITVEAGTGQLTAAVRGETGAVTTVNWSSSDTSVATVDSSGLVTGTGIGVAVITASAGSGAFVARIPVTVNPQTPQTPRAPTNVVAVFNASGAATVSWTPPAFDGGAAITSYTVTSTPGGLTCTVNSGTGPFTCIVTGLTNGNAYSFQVTATNSAGTSTAGVSVVNFTACTTPDAPTGVSVIPRPYSGVVFWSAPASNGGAVITSYVATATPGYRTCRTTSLAPAAAPLTCTIPGLVNGVAYTVAIVAYNLAGASPASAASSAVTPRDVPGAPTNIRIVGFGDRQLNVAWAAPSTDGGGAIVSYTAIASPGGANCTAAAPSTACNITGLVNGVAYAVSVQAINAVGPSSWAFSSTMETPRTLPRAPISVAAVPYGYRAMTVSWTAPDAAGSPVTSYHVMPVGAGGQSCGTSGTPPATSCVVFNLTSGGNYSFVVKARNAVGLGAASAATEIVTAPLDPALATPLPTVTPSPTLTTSPTVTAVATTSPSATLTRGAPTPSGTPSFTSTGTYTPTFTPSQTITPTVTRSGTTTPSFTPTNSGTRTGTLTPIPTRSSTRTVTATRTPSSTRGASPSSSSAPRTFAITVTVRLALAGVTTSHVQNTAFTDALKASIAKSARVPVSSVRLIVVQLRLLEEIYGAEPHVRRSLQASRLGLDVQIDLPLNETTVAATNTTGGANANPPPASQSSASFDPDAAASVVETNLVTSLNAAVTTGALFNSTEMATALVQVGLQQNALSAAIIASSSSVAATVITPSVQAPGSAGGISGGAIAGIAIAIIFVIVVAGAIGYCYSRANNAGTGPGTEATKDVPVPGPAAVASAPPSEASVAAHVNVEMGAQQAVAKTGAAYYASSQVADLRRTASTRRGSVAPRAGQMEAGAQPDDPQAFEPVPVKAGGAHI